MSDAPSALVDLAASVERSIADGAFETERDVQLRAVEPLVEVLGWDLRGSEVVPAATVAGTEVDYVLTVDDRPVIAIGTAAPDDAIDRQRDRIESVMTEAGIRRGLVSDGRSVTLLATHRGELRRRSFPFADIAQHTSALEQLHRDVLASTPNATPEQRHEARRRLAANQDALVDTIAEDICSVTGQAVEPTVVDESERAIDSLLDSLDHSEVTRGADPETEESSSGDDPEASASRSSTSDASQPTPQRAEPGGKRGESSGGGFSSPPDVAESSTSGDDASYVARFFSGSSSVGAVGTDSPSGTTAGVAQYLLENHDLASSITLPWRVDGGSAILVDSEPDASWTELRRADGTSFWVRPLDDPGHAKDVIEGLGSAAGLRVMFQGDW